MVKGIVKFVLQADYEAQRRTVPVSQKPAMGKELFGVRDQLSGIDSRFETERFVHGQIHQYLLRSAARLQDAQRKGRESRIQSPAVEAENMRRISILHCALKLSSNSALPAVSDYEQLRLIPHLRAFVVAQMLKDFITSINGNSASLSKEQLRNRLVIRRLLRQLGATILADEKILGHSTLRSSRSLSLCVAEKRIGASCGSSSSRNCPSLVNSRLQVHKCARDGFSTAPIRYQQSMENGPPS